MTKLFQIFEINFQKILKSPTKLFDVVILELIFDFGDCFLPVAKKFDIPVIGTIATTSWLSMEWIMGNPSNPAINPTVISTYSYPMTYVQRLGNLWKYWSHLVFRNYYTFPELKKFYRKFFPNYFNFADQNEMSLVFSNSLPVLTPRSKVPTIINVGGLHIQPAKPLPEVSNLRLLNST